MPIVPNYEDDHPSKIAFDQWMAEHAPPNVDQQVAWSLWVAGWDSCYAAISQILSMPVEKLKAAANGKGKA